VQAGTQGVWDESAVLVGLPRTGAALGQLQLGRAVEAAPGRKRA